jgi:hypothetical protein
MGVITEFMGELTTSRSLTSEELAEYKNKLNDEYDMYLIFTSSNRLEGPESAKVVGYIDMVDGFMKTFTWLNSKGITLSGRINYACEDIFSEAIGGGFGAFVVTPENVTYYTLDLNGLQMISTVIYRN